MTLTIAYTDGRVVRHRFANEHSARAEAKRAVDSPPWGARCITLWKERRILLQVIFCG
jgi:hypothetical protein